jgi:hypothetical protein
MSDAAQLYQKLLTDAIRKQMVILGPEIALLKARTVSGLTVTDDGTVASLGAKPEDIVTRFLAEFRDLSTPLVKKTMQPLLNALGTGMIEQAPTQPQLTSLSQSQQQITENPNQNPISKT